jgi:hypothetical protein
MKEIVYSFYNTLGDKFYLRLLCEGEMYLSQEIVSYLKEKDFELWGIYLDRLGNAQKVTISISTSFLVKFTSMWLIRLKKIFTLDLINSICHTKKNKQEKKVTSRPLFSCLFHSFFKLFPIFLANTIFFHYFCSINSQ